MNTELSEPALRHAGTGQNETGIVWIINVLARLARTENTIGEVRMCAIVSLSKLAEWLGGRLFLSLLSLCLFPRQARTWQHALAHQPFESSSTASPMDRLALYSLFRTELKQRDASPDSTLRPFSPSWISTRHGWVHLEAKGNPQKSAIVVSGSSARSPRVASLCLGSMTRFLAMLVGSRTVRPPLLGRCVSDTGGCWVNVP